MFRISTLTLLVTLAANPGTQPAPSGRDPAVTDGDKYQVLLENEHVRVLRYRDQPGARTHLHDHPCFVMYALGPFRRQLTLPDGGKRVRELKAGEVAWMPAQSHIGENVGTTATDALLVELKGAGQTGRLGCPPAP
jgi:quercetin dioxygenase-like cupin family protein